MDFESLYIRSAPGSVNFQRAERALERDDELERLEQEGHYSPLMVHAEEMETAAGQLRLEMTDYDTRGNVRLEVARYLERTVLPGSASPQLRKLVNKLREARRRCWFQLDTESGATRTLWETKAGEPLLCPDDAREEAMRLQRRLEETIGDLARKGYRVYYGVLTIDNAPAGLLRSRIESLWKKWRRALKARLPNKPGERIPAKKRKLRFPFVGAIATLEAPLGSSRTWHPHLNVIVITKGFFDWTDWWSYWNCVSDWKAIQGGPTGVAAAFRELIKYSVRAVPEKSAAKASDRVGRSQSGKEPSGAGPPSHSEERPADDRPSPPAMTEWTASEWLEWWGAMKGRRRTRTYGELFGLNVEPEPEEEGRIWRTFGSGSWAGSRYVCRFPLLESIPGDKSIRDPRARREKYLAELTGPPERWAALSDNLAQWRQSEAFEALKASEPTLS